MPKVDANISFQTSEGSCKKTTKNWVSPGKLGEKNLFGTLHRWRGWLAAGDCRLSWLGMKGSVIDKQAWGEVPFLKHTLRIV